MDAEQVAAARLHIDGRIQAAYNASEGDPEIVGECERAREELRELTTSYNRMRARVNRAVKRLCWLAERHDVRPGHFEVSPRQVAEKLWQVAEELEGHDGDAS